MVIGPITSVRGLGSSFFSLNTRRDFLLFSSVTFGRLTVGGDFFIARPVMGTVYKIPCKAVCSRMEEI